MTSSEAGVRAASLAASAMLLGLATLAALTATIALTRIEPALPTPEAIEMVRPPPPPTPVRPLETPRAPVSEEAIAIAPPRWEEAAPLEDFAGPEMLGPPAPPLITNPHWTRRPRDLDPYYPGRALRLGVEGEAALDCVVSIAGVLRCVVISETPAGWGFGEAALRMAHDHRMAPATRGGAPVEGRYRMRVPFETR